VLGCFPQIQSLIQSLNLTSRFVGGYRITDRPSLVAAMEAAGQVRLEVEARLSKGPSIAMVRRHERMASSVNANNNHALSFHHKPALQVVSGNYVMARRRGIVDGVNYLYTGEVRFVQGDLIRQQLNNNCVVILNNIGFTNSGEVLNCNTYEVAREAATAVGADKLIFFTLQDVDSINLPRWLPLLDAEALLKRMAYNREVEISAKQNRQADSFDDFQTDLDAWSIPGCPWELSSSVSSCRAGVKRAHLIPAFVEGSLLLELYTRDGVGTMISKDFYEGCRPAHGDDLDKILALLEPLEKAGVMAPRSREKMVDDLQYYFVIEREGIVMACAALIPLSASLAEVAAFAVHPDHRGGGKGDSLLEYLEQVALTRGIENLCLLTTRTADWFQQRGFDWAGPAHLSEILPEARRSRINPSRNSILFVKSLGTSL